jgi:hypothetical protein
MVEPGLVLAMGLHPAPPGGGWAIFSKFICFFHLFLDFKTSKT